MWNKNQDMWAFDQPLWEKKKESKKDKGNKTEEQHVIIKSFKLYVPWADILHHSDNTKVLLCNCL